MLPDRSKRYAGIDGDIPRLILAPNWQLLLVALLVLALLALIFPRQVLVEKLYEQETLDDLTLSYVQNLYRADTTNADLAILLAKFQQQNVDIVTLESMLLPWANSEDVRQRTEVRLMLFNAYEKALAANPQASERARLQGQLTVLLQNALREKNPDRLVRVFAAAAFELDQPQLGLAFLEKIEVGHSSQTLEKYGKTALARGDYGLAAEYFLMAREQVTELDEARRLFQAGVGALMAASRFKQAMQAAQMHLGHLDRDPATLRYLARAALAAGDPAQASRYARALVFRDNHTPTAP